MKFQIILFLLASIQLNAQENALQQSKLSAKLIYKKKCAVCHGQTGEGKNKRIPPLANSDYLQNNIEESIKGILFGQDGAIMVNGMVYNKKMKAIKLTDYQIAEVLNFILSSWNTSSELEVTESQVMKIRSQNQRIP